MANNTARYDVICYVYSMSPLVSCMFQRNTGTKAVAREWLSGMEAQRGTYSTGPLFHGKSRLVKILSLPRYMETPSLSELDFIESETVDIFP